jgi:hypothetical protein
MNRRAFIQGLIGLASMPAIGKYINIFKPSAVREGITQAADNTMSKGIEFYEAVIKRVMDEGTITGEADRFRTYKHPDKPDISVELNVGTGDTAVYFDTDRGSRAGAEITSDLEVPQAGKELMENEEVYRMGGDDYYKDVDEEITGGVGSLEEWIKRKRGYVAGGRVGMWKGGGIKVGKNIMNLLRNNKKIREAIDNIFPTGDYKYDAEMAVESLVELNPQVFGGKLADDLDDALRSEIYGAVLNPIMQDHALLAQMKRASKPIKTLEGIENTGTINISDPNVADEFARFMKESDPTGFKDLEQKVELSNFNPKGRKKNAQGGIIGLTNNPMTASNKAGVETLFERR